MLLAAKGYCVLPVTGQTKFPGIAGWSKMGPDQCKVELARAIGITGWTLRLAPSDPVKIVVLDVDKPENVDAKALWRALSPLEPLPDNVPMVRTTSGGLHLYFRAPAGHELRKPQIAFTVGDFKGDIRASADGGRGIMLGGSTAKGKNGLGQYTWETPFNLEKIPEMPLAVFNKVCAPPSLTNSVAQPTELHRLFDTFLSLVPDNTMPNGCWANNSYHFGMICGRVWGREKPTVGFRGQALDFLERIADTTGEHEFSQGEAESNFLRGWDVGWKNVKGKKTVLPSEAAAEAAGLFSAPVTMQTNTERGKVKSYVLTVGKRSEEVASLGNREEVLGLLSQMGNCPEDTLGQSPLALELLWWKAFQRHLHTTTRRSKVLGDDLEEFVDTLRQQVRDAANGGAMGASMVDGATDKADGSGVDQFKPWLQVAGSELNLMVPGRLMDKIMAGCSGVAQHQLEELGEKKRRGVRFWQIPLQPHLDKDGKLSTLVNDRYLEMRREALKK